MSKFTGITTDELLAEIVRRRNARVARRPIVKCEECQYFKPSEKADDSYNPCSKGHKINFRMPEADDGPSDSNDDWGFYRSCCPDRMPT